MYTHTHTLEAIHGGVCAHTLYITYIYKLVSIFLYACVHKNIGYIHVIKECAS